MTNSRGLLFVASSSLLAAWFVTLGVRMSLGAPATGAPPALGALPPARRALAPLRIPGRDPFAADVAAQGPALAAGGERASLGPIGAGPALPRPETDVPDVAAVGGAAPGVGIIATIVSDADAYALVDERGTSRIARVHDALAGSTIATISNDAVTLANGVRVPLQADGASAPPPSVGTVQPGSLPAAYPPGSGPRSSEVRAEGSAVPAALGTPADDRVGTAAVRARATTDISTYGHTVLSSPNGAPVLQGPAGVAMPIASPPTGASTPWLPGTAPAPVWAGTGSPR
jgi:hypothetical protein